MPPVDELSLREVEWIIISEDNIEEKLAKLKARGIPLGLFSLTGDGYENLSLNLSDIRALVQQQQSIIMAYENYYVATEAAIDAANKNINNVNSN